MGIIYCYTNKINGKKYIGQTINPNSRYNAHKSAVYNTNNQEYNTPVHQAMRKYGYENFSYEVLEENIDDVELLNKLESYYIKTMHTLTTEHGYNILPGGYNSKRPPFSEEHKRKLSEAHSKLSYDEIVFIRHKYSEGDSPSKIYNTYFKNKVNYTSFLNIWTGKRYGHILPELINSGRHTKMTKDKVLAIRKDRDSNSLSYAELANKYGCSKSTIADIISRRTWKNI